MSEQFKVEKPETKEKFSSQIRLRFFRHAEKEPKKEGQIDTEIRISAEGKKRSAGASDLEDISQAVAFGSPRKRAQETAGLVMAGEQEEITGEESLEELKAIVDKSLKVGSKIAADKRLDFNLDSKTSFGKLIHKAFGEGRLLKFFVEESDKLAKELNAGEQSTYIKSAAGIAQIIEKYLKIAPRWNELAQDKEKEYDPTLERLLGSHQSVPECFLAKVIEKMKGTKERDKFVRALDNAGFDYVEGYEVNIINEGKEQPRVHISYKKEKDDEVAFEFDEDISTELINEIAHPEEEK